MSLTAGVRVGPYEIVSPLGAGGMGDVYRARDSRLGRDVAIKVLRPTFATDQEWLRRFEKEARAVAALNHPNILALYDIGSHEGAPYLVEELLEGQPLSRCIGDRSLTVTRSVALVVQVARGLAAAHARGIVHRDLKPDNVFVTQDGVVKLLDFGLAKLVELPDLAGEPTLTQSAQTDPGQVMGTLGYMAPEQARGQVIDHRADLFSLGVVLYEMLAGVRPFTGRSFGETISAILTQDPPPLPNSVPVPLKEVVGRCLEKRPGDRFSSAQDVAFALEAAVAGSGVPGVPARTSRPTLLRLAAATAGLLFAVGLWLTLRAPSGSSVSAAEATLFRYCPGRLPDEALSSGSTLVAGDEVYLQVRSAGPVWVYVLDRDAENRTYALFPTPGGTLSNPLAAGVVHRLPPAGPEASDAGVASWVLDDVGTSETFLVVVSGTSLPELARRMALLQRPTAAPGRSSSGLKPGHGRGVSTVRESGEDDVERALGATLAQLTADAQRGGAVKIVQIVIRKEAPP